MNPRIIVFTQVKRMKLILGGEATSFHMIIQGPETLKIVTHRAQDSIANRNGSRWCTNNLRKGMRSKRQSQKRMVTRAKLASAPALGQCLEQV